MGGSHIFKDQLLGPNPPTKRSCFHYFLCLQGAALSRGGILVSGFSISAEKTSGFLTES